MADSRFFAVTAPLPLSRLAEIAEAELAGGVDPARLIRDVAPLDLAGPEELSFLDNKLYVDAFAKSGAGACIVTAEHAARAPDGMALLISRSPYRAYARVAAAFYPEAALEGAVHERAIVHPSAEIGDGTRIEAGAVVGANAKIGGNCLIGENVVIGDAVEIGDGVEIGPNASLSYCLVGSRVLIHPGVRLGQRGFGFAMSEEGHFKVPQLGRVIVEDDVEIGANSTIDRGASSDTVIGQGSMIDNLVQIGHNVRMGKGCVVVAQAGVAGSTRLEDHVILAAQAGLVGHLTIGTGARVAAQAGIMRDVPAGETVCGSPAVPIKQFFRQTAAVARLAKQKGK
ncbi:MAG: UDP-3-O-(3-hydroxymyristoyl)glucosamine N-acyltransferase [Rhodospirillaceae bacterium]|jgi:UDP-3-O-[3-hydroxymyristoyl] glucosamine N-acyltransferase|nr:UDP-3-O-(3-hydroxymyristoyl)glucosamine N-acyltransferase [Rhodospirillaceae bacterium]MBT6117043.1 UDP-3-O-(3-hydroxymyristoyl)glucosamine N-acyltransferase [Rhodospirillaceae bacterium]